MKDLRSILAGLVGGVLVSLCVWGISSIGNEEVAFELPSDFNIEDHIDLSELMGTDGDDGIGYRGMKGEKGDKGEIGAQGVAGSTPTIDIVALANEVADELEDRDDRPLFSTSGEEGNFVAKFDIDDDDSYIFTLTHFGSGDFVVSLVNEDDDVDTLVDTEGHANKTRNRSLDKGTYTLHVSADGDWKVSIED